MAKIPAGVGPKLPQIVVLFGATGDLAHKKLLPGLFHCRPPASLPKCRIIGVSLDPIDAEGFRALARDAVFEQHQPHTPRRRRGRRSKRRSTMCRSRPAPALSRKRSTRREVLRRGDASASIT